MPRLAERLVDRDVLLRRLDRLAPLSVVRALRGTGKTTVLAQWVRAQQALGARIIWAKGDVDGLVDLLDEAPRWALEQRTIVVIDDAHQLGDPRFLADVAERLANAPRLHVVLGTHVHHPLQDLARSVGLEVTVLRNKDLMVPAEQIPAYARAWGHDIDVARARQIHDAVGGWLVAIQVVLDHTAPEDEDINLGATQAFFRAVASEVTDEIGLRQAMSLALADRVDEDLARALGVDEVALTRLERHSLLERDYTETGRLTYRFPTLVRRFLADGFVQRDPAGAAHVHRAIAEHLSSRHDDDDLGRIIVHARAGESWATLERLWAQKSLTLILSWPAEAVAAYTDVPSAAVDDHRLLGLAQAVVTCLRHRDVDELAVVHDFAERNEDALDKPGAFESPDAELLTTVAVMVARRAKRDVDGALALAARFRDRMMSAIGAGGGGVVPANQVWFDLQWAVTASMGHHLDEAIDTASRAFAAARVVGAELLAVRAAGQLALDHACSGHLKDAAQWLEVHDRSATRDRWPVATLPARLAEMIMALDRLDESVAQCSHEVAELRAHRAESIPAVAWVRTRSALLFGDPASMLHEFTSREDDHDPWVRRCHADVLIALGELNRADRLLRGDESEDPAVSVVRARLSLICGDFSAARASASATAWDARTLPRDRAELLMIKAAAALAMGDEVAAGREFARAHALAEATDTLMPYLGIPSSVRDRLFAMTGGRLGDGAAARVAACGDVYPTSGTLVTLSPRELVVLGEMAVHPTLADIAESLTVSVHTVKKQTVAIYAKLGVNDRASALLCASRLGLLPVGAVGER